MVGWLFQQSPDTLQLKMTRVNSCGDVVYSGVSTSPPIPPPVTQSPPVPPPPLRPRPTNQMNSSKRALYVILIAGFNAALGGLLAIGGFTLNWLLARLPQEQDAKPVPTTEEDPTPIDTTSQVAQVHLQSRESKVNEELNQATNESSALLGNMKRVVSST